MNKALVCVCLFTLLGISGYAAGPDLPLDRTVLPNGLTLITLEDHREPIVAITIWYHVGAKDEKAGRAGFAHLFEHIMFEGSEHHRQNFVKAMENVGASGLNGVTNQDRTAYFETVPSSSLDYALWLESDRMGHLLGAIDQTALDVQRGVIENERRQEEDANYAISTRLIAENTYPPGHPYSRSAIGEKADLKAASLADVQEWFETYYGAANALIVLAGDITPSVAKEKVQKYFGGIAPGQPITHQVTWVAKMSGTHRQTVQDRVPQPRIYKVWNIPEFASADSSYLDLVSDCLARGKSSRLYQRIVSEGQLADDVRAYVRLKEVGSQFVIEATARPRTSLDMIERKLDEELARFLRDGPTTEELQRIKAQYSASYFRNSDPLGSLGGRSDRVAQAEVFGLGVGGYKLVLERVQNASLEDLKGAARRWLADGVYVLDVLPFAFPKSGGQTAVAEPPPLQAPSRLRSPKLETTTLANGLKIIVAERHEVPLVNVWLTLDAGFAADPCDLPGVASMTLAALDGGTLSRSGAQIAKEFDALGSELRADTNTDLSTIRLSTLKANLSASLDLFADVLLHPIFPREEFKLEQKRRLAAIQREENTPMFMALRALPRLLYQPDCGSGNPFTGIGTPASIERMTREDVALFHSSWFRPNNATLIVVGDITPAEIKAKVESAFAGWKTAPIAKKNSAIMQEPRKPIIYLIDKPGAQQSFIVAAGIGLRKADPREIAAEAVNDDLGGNLGSRLNLNLREEKHWSYGVRSRLWGTRNNQPFITYASVQSDKTGDAMNEIKREFAAIQSNHPVDDQELVQIKANQSMRLPASQETLDSLTQSIADLVQFNLPDNYFDLLYDQISALNTEKVREAATALIHPDKIVWVVVGDKAKLQINLREAGMSDVQVASAKP